MKHISNKKGQEEMVGFALIIIVVSIILIFFLAFALTRDNASGVDSYEAESFIQSFLQYTTTCEQGFSRLDVQDIIFECVDSETCNSGENACAVLNETLKGIVESSWNVEEGNFYSAYELEILSEKNRLIYLTKGNLTNTYKGALQSFAQSGDSVDVIFRVYN